jgi:LEA14-like dessication related protein
MAGQARMRRRVALLAVVLGIAALSGCPDVAARVAIKDCQFNVTNVQLRAVRGLNLHLDVTLGVFNPNKQTVIVDRFDYTVLLNGLKVADGAMQRDVEIPMHQSRDLPMSVRINAMDAARVGMALRRRGARRVALKGTYYVRVPWGRYPFPVDIQHRF